MKFQSILRGAVVSGFMLGASFAAQAQDVTPSHLAVAKQVIAAIQITNVYDNVLPQAVYALKTELISQNPDKQEEISQLVETKALDLAGRRADLENEAALAFAKAIPEPDLKAIADFYGSDAGKKLLEAGPIATREVVKAADIWQKGIARDLAQSVGAEMAKSAPQAQGVNPEEAVKPAPAPAN